MRGQTIRGSDRGYMVIPADVRRRLHIEKGTHLLLTEQDDTMVLRPVTSFTEGLAGLTRGAFGSTPEEVQDYLDRERKKP
jgi:AbrB family looped-hinge helix DNA binding protein